MIESIAFLKRKKERKNKEKKFGCGKVDSWKKFTVDVWMVFFGLHNHHNKTGDEMKMN